MRIEVTEDFIKERTDKTNLYNQRERSENKFLMDLDCEIVEHLHIKQGLWEPHDSWMVDAVIDGKNCDLKFIQKFWNISSRKIVNILRQRNTIDEYHFWEWVRRPHRPLRAGDEVEVRQVGVLHYDVVADNLQASFKVPGGHYVAVRTLL